MGDFATRRLPPSFVNAWDTWLSIALHESRRRLGERWLDAYLSAPLWRFVADHGAAGDGAWVGLLMSSVDRVGRYFPLTIARGLAQVPIDAHGLLAVLQDQEDEAKASLATLSEGRPLDAFEADLLRCAGTREPPAPGEEVVGPLSIACERLASQAAAGGPLVPRGGSLWVEYAETAAELRCVALAGLPSPDDYIALLSD